MLVPETQGLLRPGRHGDQQPAFHGVHLTHKRWFKQLRRLEAYARSSQASQTPNVSKTLHLTREWRAILGAAGFPGGFQLWWACRPSRLPNTVYDLPNSPLPAQDARNLCLAFESEVRALETVLIKELKAKVQQAHSDNPNKVFLDAQKPKVQPVQMLTDQVTTTVTEISADEMAFTCEAQPNFDPDRPLLSSKGPLQPVVITEDKIWVENLPPLDPGDKVFQENHVGDLVTLFERFGKEWSARWDKHLTTASDHWDPLLEFIDTAIPQHPEMPYEKITPEQIYQNVRSKKPGAATGPDGWSRQDILRMAPDLLEAVDSFVDEEGDKINIWDIPIQELQIRVAEAWQKQVAGGRCIGGV
eukprot:s2207_g8.t1